MDSLGKEYLISFYDKNLMMHGDRPEALRWTPKGQIRRYAQLLEIADDLDGAKILDYGCGKGDLLDYIKSRGFSVEYTGTDINQSLINLARSKHPDGSFHVFDIEEGPLTIDFDYVFLCGVFNNRVEGATESMANVMKLLFDRTRIGMAVSSLSSKSPYKDFELNYIDPDWILDYAANNITPHLRLRDDCDGGDLTLYLYKDPGN